MAQCSFVPRKTGGGYTAGALVLSGMNGIRLFDGPLFNHVWVFSGGASEAGKEGFSKEKVGITRKRKQFQQGSETAYGTSAAHQNVAKPGKAENESGLNCGEEVAKVL